MLWARIDCAVEGNEFLQHVFWKILEANDSADHPTDYTRVCVGVATLADGLTNSMMVSFIYLHALGPQHEII